MNEIDNSKLTADRIQEDLIKIAVGSLIGVLVYILFTSILLNDEFERYIFLGHIGNFYPYFLILGLLIMGFSALLLYRSYNLGHSSLNILILAVFLSGLSYVFGFLNFDPTGTVNFRQTRLFQLQVLSQTIGVFLFYLHYELNSYTKPRTGFMITVILLLWPLSFLNIYYLLTNNFSDNEIVNQIQIFSQLLLQIGVILVFGWLLYNGIEISKIFLRRDDRTRKAVIYQLSGFFILVIGIVFQLVETITPVNVWHTPLNAIAILLIGIPYFQNANVMIFSPVNVMVIGVVDTAGRTMYFQPVDRSFADDEAIQTTSDLFGGLTLALSSMGKEVAKSTQSVDSLQFSDRSIIVEHSDPYYLVVIANTSTYYLEREMEEYLEDLTLEYPNVPSDGSVIPENVFNHLNSKFFPIILQIN